MNAVIFWHTYLIGDYKLVVQEQMTKLFTSGLYNAVDCIYTGISATSDEDVNWFKNLLKSYSKFFPIVHSDTNGEKPTMKLLYNYAKENNSYIFYFHTKAISNTGYNKTLWRLSMDYNNIYRWNYCIEKLNSGADAVGCNLRKHTYLGYYPHFSGNAWWSKSEYIKTLNEEYLNDSTLLGESNRLTVEFFIGSNIEGKLESIFECQNDAPYNDETLINQYIRISEQ